MENIEELKQSNAKLTERLNNAAKFFREQKAQIEALTKDKEDLVKKVDDYNKQLNEYELKLQSVENNETQANWEAKCEELEKTIQSKDQAYKVLQDTYNEVFAEKEKITKQYKEQEKFETEVINKKVPELEEKLKNSEAAFEQLRKKYDEIKKLHDGDLNRYNELETNYEKLQNKYKENDIARGEAELKAENIQAEYTQKFKDQDTQIDSLKKKLEDEVNNNAVNKTQLDDAKEHIKKQDQKIKDLESINDTLGHQLDDEENHRLSIESDYNNLVEKVNKEDENICKFNKKDINEFCDNMLDFFKNHRL